MLSCLIPSNRLGRRYIVVRASFPVTCISRAPSWSFLIHLLPFRTSFQATQADSVFHPIALRPLHSRIAMKNELDHDSMGINRLYSQLDIVALGLSLLRLHLCSGTRASSTEVLNIQQRYPIHNDQCAFRVCGKLRNLCLASQTTLTFVQSVSLDTSLYHLPTLGWGPIERGQSRSLI